MPTVSKAPLPLIWHQDLSTWPLCRRRRFTNTECSSGSEVIITQLWNMFLTSGFLDAQVRKALEGLRIGDNAQTQFGICQAGSPCSKLLLDVKADKKQLVSPKCSMHFRMQCGVGSWVLRVAVLWTALFPKVHYASLMCKPITVAL
jgi:hypothetical protein